MSETVEPISEGEFKGSDRQVVRARSDRTFSDPWALPLVPVKKKEMGHRSKRVE